MHRFVTGGICGILLGGLYASAWYTNISPPLVILATIAVILLMSIGD